MGGMSLHRIDSCGSKLTLIALSKSSVKQCRKLSATKKTSHDTAGLVSVPVTSVRFSSHFVQGMPLSTKTTSLRLMRSHWTR